MPACGELLDFVHLLTGIDFNVLAAYIAQVAAKVSAAEQIRYSFERRQSLLC
jgi:hypothetical protein